MNETTAHAQQNTLIRMGVKSILSSILSDLRNVSGHAQFSANRDGDFQGAASSMFCVLCFARKSTFPKEMPQKTCLQVNSGISHM